MRNALCGGIRRWASVGHDTPTGDFGVTIRPQAVEPAEFEAALPTIIEVLRREYAFARAEASHG
ncbi:hypothetical protein R69658_07841 [Paraburkholderia aspalathi]|uniref:Uncharacterized protein n=1 Tax=Paraburkholderia aspalathi TaxID=1324617 RepID=A0ABM8T853_9BURK|nr:hypothetical protein [Paraburkholderia aspalathi]MBK3824111.1 hypothetical protein [Paraburkholderia aspalathi]MBK3835953.1 hypothetical protein [Paraburkholderia aspalathi]MBK3865729.1 hypothetical protein [Paraburkholderia aspalathi]CAE6865545.1 hypothetical protein R69658_07841 [Paraburkholderia aspalathi]